MENTITSGNMLATPSVRELVEALMARSDVQAKECLELSELSELAQ